MRSRTASTTILLFFVSVIAISCDPVSTWEYYVENESDSTIFVRYKAYEYSDTAALSLPAGMRAQVYSVEQRGKLEGPNENFLRYSLEDFQVLRDTASRLSIRKDFTSLESWTYDGEKTGGTWLVPMGVNRYTLTVRQADF